MRRVLVFCLLGLLMASVGFAQPVLRDGWPQDLSAGGNNPFTSVNPLAVVEDSDGSRYIAAATTNHIRLFSIDGELLQEWACADLVPAEPTADYLAGGPQIADVDGDGELEVIAMLRRNTATSRAIAVLEFDGTLNTTLSRGHTLAQVDISTFACADVDGDGFDEIIYSTSAEIHAIDQSGSEVDGFPWNVSRPHIGAGPVVVPADVNGGTAVVVWPGQDLQMHARAADGDADLAGWPVGFVAPTGFQMSPPMVIPSETGWYVAFAGVNGVYLWDQDGTLQENFPVAPQNVDASLLMFSGAADVDGDSTPEILFRSWNSDYVSAVGLDGAYLDGYPFSTGTEAGRSESVAVLKPTSDAVGYQFFASLGPGGNDLTFFGRDGLSNLTGFPVAVTTTEQVPMTSTAVFKPVDGTMSIVYSTQWGYTTVYDLEIDYDANGRIEWGMPHGHANGNRVYRPEVFVSFEGPIFGFAPATHDFGEVEVGETVTFDVTVGNYGTQAGELTSADFVHGDDLSLDATLPVSLDPGATATWTISWSPTTAGDLSDSLHIVHDEDIDGTDSYVGLVGLTVQYPELMIPETVDFGMIYSDDPVGEASLVIENTGEADGIIDEVIVNIAHQHLLSVGDVDFPLTIEPGGTVTIPLLWEPIRDGAFSSSVVVYHNDPELGGETTVAVMGELVNDAPETGIPSVYALEQNHPNPFNPQTSIRYSLKQAGEVTLTVYNVEGREVATLVQGQKQAGWHQVQFDGSRFASGVYLYSIQVNDFRALRKMVLVQ
ncbi:choice-of-anchor D domain-containing protein [bacterium]|nr:choice-of-anchor D domain-containing protein [bacterium]